MAREVVGRLRLAVAREVGRRRAADEPRRADLAPDEVLAADRADAHGDVEALVDEVDDAVGQLDVEAHLRVARDERGDRRARGGARRT